MGHNMHMVKKGAASDLHELLNPSQAYFGIDYIHDLVWKPATHKAFK